MPLALIDSLRAGLDGWFARNTSQLADDPLMPLPGERIHALQQRIDSLEVPFL